MAGCAGACAFLQRNFADDENSQNNATLPTGSSILVVGAGVVGVATAHELARRGFKVKVLEQGAEVCGMQSASWGNAGTLGVSKQTTPLAKAPFTVSDGLRKTWAAAAPSNGAGVFFDSATLKDKYFWLWGLTFVRAFFGTHLAFLDSVWRDLNHEAQRVLFDVAEEEGLLEEADLRRDGRCILKTAAHEGAAPAAAAAAAAAAPAFDHDGRVECLPARPIRRVRSPRPPHQPQPRE